MLPFFLLVLRYYLSGTDPEKNIFLGGGWS